MNTKKYGMYALMSIFIIAMLTMSACSPLSIRESGGVATTPIDAGCQIAPSVSLSVVDKELPGTAVTTGTQYIVNGLFASGTPTLVKGDKVRVIANASSYIDAVSAEKIVGCGANRIDMQVYDFAAPTVVIKDDTTTLTDNVAGGASNASAIAAGGSDTYTILVTPSNNDATGELLFVVELGASANVSDITLSDQNGVQMPKATVPSFYSNSLTSPKVVAFNIPNMVDAVEKTYKMTVQLQDSKSLNGAVYTTFYVKEAFVDNDGKVVESGVETSTGTAKYEATFDYDFFITA